MPLGSLFSVLFIHMETLDFPSLTTEQLAGTTWHGQFWFFFLAAFLQKIAPTHRGTFDCPLSQT